MARYRQVHDLPRQISELEQQLARLQAQLEEVERRARWPEEPTTDVVSFVIRFSECGHEYWYAAQSYMKDGRRVWTVTGSTSCLASPATWQNMLEWIDKYNVGGVAESKLYARPVGRRLA